MTQNKVIISEPTSTLAFVDSILSRNLQWIAAADSKVPPVLAIDTAMLGVLAANLPRGAWPTSTAVVVAIATFLLLVSLLGLVVAKFPRLDGPKGSLIFFGGISSRNEDQYVQQLAAASLDDLLDDLSRQIHRNARIAQTKYGAIQASMIALFIAIPIWLAAIALLYSGNGVAEAAIGAGF